MLALGTLTALVMLGILFDRLWNDGSGLRRASPAMALPTPPADLPVAERSDGKFRAELDRILRILDTGDGPRNDAGTVEAQNGDDPAPEAPAPKAEAGAEPEIRRLPPAGGAEDAGPAQAGQVPESLPLIEGFDTETDLLVIEVDHEDASVSLRADAAGAGTVLSVDGVDQARILPANGTFDARMLRLVAA